MSVHSIPNTSKHTRILSLFNSLQILIKQHVQTDLVSNPNNMFLEKDIFTIEPPFFNVAFNVS